MVIGKKRLECKSQDFEDGDVDIGNNSNKGPVTLETKTKAPHRFLGGHTCPDILKYLLNKCCSFAWVHFWHFSPSLSEIQYSSLLRGDSHNVLVWVHDVNNVFQ